MNSRRIALWAASAAATFWTIKTFAIAAAGGLDKSPIEGPMFLAGLVSFVIAAVAIGVALTPATRTWLRAVGGIGAFAAGFGFTMAVDAVVELFHADGVERHWVWVEFNLWVAALVGLLVALRVNRGPSGNSQPQLEAAAQARPA